MRNIIYIILLVFCISCNGQSVQYGSSNRSTKDGTPIIDTLSIVSLKNKQYEGVDYKVLRLCNLDSSGYWIDTSRRIELTRENKTVVSISLPIPDEDLKNFSITKLEETDSGFKVVANWGGGNNFYGREFCFTFKGEQFYLDSLKMSSYTQEPEKENKTIKTISPSIPIDAFDIFQYFENE